MGAVVAGDAVGPVMWASEGRSPETHDRAQSSNLVDVQTPEDLVDQCDVLISVCPPDAAVDLAATIRDHGFDGVYVDANAIAPDTARHIGSMFGRFVDGGIVGPPPNEPDTTRLYLAGYDADLVASLWESSNLDARVLAGPVGSASALKASYAGWSKGTSALLLAIRAFAAANDVEDALLAEWESSIPGLVSRSDATSARIGLKAWRFESEMAEIAAAMETAGLPAGFLEASKDIYHRLAHLKGTAGHTTDEIISVLLEE
ncbi:MAG: DUF1932 domain-containing protein [Acidimicrobiia bacterium]